MDTPLSLPPQQIFAPLYGWEAFSISGPDREKFVKGLVSNKVRGFSTGSGNPTLILSVKGRIITELLFLNDEDRYLFLAPPKSLKHALHFFNHYHVIEDVTIQEEASLDTFVMAGEQLPDYLEKQALSMPAFVMTEGKEPKPEAGEGITFTTGDEQLWATRFALLGDVPMLVGWGTKDASQTAQAKLEADGFQRLSQAQWAQLQTEYKWYDAMSELRELLVHETGLQDSHVHFNKGCWVGQEVVARTHYRGKANKGLFLPSSDDTSALEAGKKIVDAEGKEVGSLLARKERVDGSTVARAILKLKSLEGDASLFLEEGNIPLQTLKG